MKKKTSSITRRDFLKAAGIAGVGSVVTPVNGLVNASEANETVATRPFGKTGQHVSILSLGGMFDIASNQLLMKQAMNWGVTYWDTADCYQRSSEKGIGKFLSRQPDARKKLFIVSKSDARDPGGMTRLLDRSLDRMQTDYIKSIVLLVGGLLIGWVAGPEGISMARSVSLDSALTATWKNVCWKPPGWAGLTAL